ncbi:MAG: hypothetical protein OXP66_13675 [Candidatus Tectomicrobia bacterium]|nr:hypothetical protein [Candidatus Tectomicrobia bacterium]
MKTMVHHSLDGRMFRVRCLVCGVYGRRERVAEEQAAVVAVQLAGAQPWWMGDDEAEANF